MKVAIRFTVDIDEDAWMETYGVERAEVRTDVKAWVEGDVKEGLADRGVLKQEGHDAADLVSD